MGKGTEPKIQRNHELADDYALKEEDGKWTHEIIDLVVKYQISPKRIYEILEVMGVPKRRKRKPKKEKEAVVDNAFLEGGEIKHVI